MNPSCTFIFVLSILPGSELALDTVLISTLSDASCPPLPHSFPTVRKEAFGTNSVSEFSVRRSPCTGWLKGHGTSPVPMTPGDHVAEKRPCLTCKWGPSRIGRKRWLHSSCLLFRSLFFCLVFDLKQLYIFFLFSKTVKIYLMAI